MSIIIKEIHVKTTIEKEAAKPIATDGLVQHVKQLVLKELKEISKRKEKQATSR